MTPLTDNPRVVLLIDNRGNLLSLGTNISPELKIEIVVSDGSPVAGVTFAEEVLGLKFVN